MQPYSQAHAPGRTKKTTGIWLALAVALGLHGFIIFLPTSTQMSPVNAIHDQIELQLTRFSPPPPVLQTAVPQAETPSPIPMPQPVSESAKDVFETPTEAVPPMSTSSLHARVLERDFETMSESEKNQMTNAILTRQFITEVSAIDQLFGKPLEQNNSEPQKEFHYPVRQSLITMLDQPLPQVPFAYTPGLVYFAYDPGVKGDIQRFWDKITPEFGWKTDNGTEFKCVWVLVIAACGWK